MRFQAVGICRYP